MAKWSLTIWRIEGVTVAHATKGIATQEFFGAENRRTPLALNLAPPGACLEMECLVIREYVLPLPKLQWVVWVPSARRALQTELALLRNSGRFVDCGRPSCVSCRLRLY